jgi:hypothetical protein
VSALFKDEHVRFKQLKLDISSRVIWAIISLGKVVNSWVMLSVFNFLRGVVVASSLVRFIPCKDNIERLRYMRRLLFIVI